MAKNIIGSYYKKGIVTFSPVFGTVQYKDIVEWILTDKLDVRFQMQLHKLIWAPDKRGV
jgi:7-carboxy-7-deazaguanine synthase